MDGGIWVVWHRPVAGNIDLFYKTSPDNGLTWSTDTLLTVDPGWDANPSIIQTVDGKIWVVWQSDRFENYDIFYKTSSDGGLSWSSETQLTTDPDWDEMPSIEEARDGTLWLVWSSYRQGNQYDLYYKTSSDGVSWSPDTQLTFVSEDDLSPSITSTDEGKVWVTWPRETPTDFDLYYRTSDATPFHDISITNVTASPTNVTVGEQVSINVTVKNQGTYSETSLKVSVYYDSTMIDKSSAFSLAAGASKTLSFTWTTTATGAYTISAEVPSVSGEVDLADNTFIDGTVNVNPESIHDIAITNVTVSPTEVILGDPVSIDVDVLNEGTAAETFNVSVYYDSVLIETRVGVSLAAGANTTVSFTWTTTAEGTFTVKAEVPSVLGETDTVDNTFIDGIVTVNPPPPVPPVASFNYSPTSPVVNQNVTFNSTSTDSDGWIVSWDWDFGDGTFGTGEIVTHTYVSEGTYNVNLTVTDNDGLTDTALQAITVLPPGEVHDIAIMSVMPNATEKYVTCLYPVSINVTVVNEGTVAETFDVTTYYNLTATEWVTIQTITVTDLAPSASTILTFNWDLSGLLPPDPLEFVPITPTIKANATIVSGETDTIDNEFIDGTVYIKVPGDANGDQVVDIIDLGMLGGSWGSRIGDLDYDPRVDFNQDGVIDIIDLGILGGYWGYPWAG